MPICPKCGNPRVDRYCAKCGTSVASGPSPATAPPRPSSASGRGVVFGIFIFGALLMGVLLFFRTTEHRLILAPAPLLQSTPPTAAELSPQLIDLRNQIDTKLRDGRTRLHDLETRAATAQNHQADWVRRRAEVENLRQRLGTARVVAEEEGRWPVRAAGRTFDRAQIKDAIDRSERFLAQNQGLALTLSADAAKLSTMATNARSEFDALSRLRDDLNAAPPDVDRLNSSRTRFIVSSARFDVALRNPDANLAAPDLPEFDLDAPQK